MISVLPSPRQKSQHGTRTGWTPDDCGRVSNGNLCLQRGPCMMAMLTMVARGF